jgi:hypothetical protein
MRPWGLLTVLLAVNAAGVFADDRKSEEKHKDSYPPVKERRKFNGQGGESYDGVVTAIDKDSLTIDGKDGGRGRQGTYKFHALDLHKAGEVQEWAKEWECRWQDVKKGDTIHVWVVRDEQDAVNTPYVYEICIRRRPGDKLPESWKPKEDKNRWLKDSLLNDIDNEIDRTDEDIQKLFPPHIDRSTGRMILPGGVPNEYKVKLTALREKLEAEKEKKDKDLKAAPPDKKK